LVGESSARLSFDFRLGGRMSTLEILQEILVKDFALDRAQITPEADLSRLGIDSLSLIDFVFKIEDRFELQIKDDMPTTLVTLSDVAEYVDRLIAEQAQSPEESSTSTAE
jgi:acyl carrier protein